MNQKNIIYVILVVLVFFGLFLFMKNKGESSPAPQNTTVNPSEEATTTANSAEKTFELVINNKKIVSGPETISAKQGDSVIIKITSDENEEFHIHGVDKSVELVANTPTELKFTADTTGRFEYELENSKTEIGALEVLP